MTGWQWCPGAWERCHECRCFVKGAWKHFINQTTANISLCAKCAGGTEALAA